MYLQLGSFLSDLNSRLDFIESYSPFNLDAGVEYAYSTLRAVRDSCFQLSDGAIEVGRRQASVIVETLESRYQDALKTKDGMADKVLEGILLMEDWVSDLETRAFAIKNAGIETVNHELELAKAVVKAGQHKAHRARQSVEVKIDFAVEKALAQAKHGLIKFEDLPEPWQNNPFILNGYRFCDGHLPCVRSIAGVHNETANIWTHLLGLGLVLAVAFYIYPEHANFQVSSTADVLVAALFFFAACKCLVCSCIMHTMNSISHKDLLERYACVDYTGISLLVGASIMTVEYTAFYCEPVSRLAYMSLTAALSVGGVYLPWNPTFNRKDLAWVRVLFYVTLAMTCFFPFGQLVATHGLEYTSAFYAPVCKSMLVYLVGAIIYASKVPERWVPGRFDYLGTSHNIWHVAVLGGIITHYFAMQEMFSQAHIRASVQCPALP